MSKERARRRAVREAEAARQKEARERRARRQAVVGRLAPGVPALPRRRRVAKVWTRRSRSQRATVVAVALAVIVLTFLLTDSWGIRVAVLALALIGTPALTTLALGRSRG
jgi:Flp pilus assembly protein TadB